MPEDLQVVILAGLPVSFDFYAKHKTLYSSNRLKVEFDCENCGSKHKSDFKHLNKRKVVFGAFCPKCVMKIATSDKGWRDRNSAAQLKIQSLPEQRKKNAAAVSKFWADNPEKLALMRENVIAANQRPEVKARMAARLGWNGKGISGSYLSKWGWIDFDSSYEFAALVALESNTTVEMVKRGPTIEYEFEGNRSYFIDFEIVFVNGSKWWCEVKSRYVGTQVDRVEKLRAKLASALNLVRQGHADKMVMVTEKNSKEVLGVELPRSTYRKALFKKHYDKIIFAKASDEERYK